MTAAQYAEEWSKTSSAIATAGGYTWMADCLGSVTNILEVGPGSGLSTKSLLAHGARVTSIEVNPEMLRRAVAQVTEDPRATFVAGNIFDGNVVAHLPREFDAVTCWLAGAQPQVIADHVGKPISEHDGTEASTYRLALQHRCFNIAQECLSPGGKVQIVDRAVIRSWQDRDQLREETAVAYRSAIGDAFVFEIDGVLLRQLDGELFTSKVRHIGDQRIQDARIIVLVSVVGTLR